MLPKPPSHASYVILNVFLFYFIFNTMAPNVNEILRPSFEKKISNALKADRVKHRLTFNPNKTSPEETLYVAVPKLEDGAVLVPG